jgi:hypothetical protein
MRWVRTHLRFGCWSAFLALTIQFLVFFGHHHLNDIAWRPAASSVFAIVSDRSAGSDAPAAPIGPPGLGFDYCAIFVASKLVGNTVPVAAPDFVLHSADHAAQPAAEIEIATTASPHLPGGARAPPRA